MGPAFKGSISILFPIIILFCLIGSYFISNSSKDDLIMLVFGVVSYLMKKLFLEAVSLVLAFVFCPMLETLLRQALIKSKGSFLIFFTRPISATFLLFAIAPMVVSLFPWFPRRPGVVLEQEETT